jgi:uncharacterized protein YggT (Ycf19 family)
MTIRRSTEQDEHGSSATAVEERSAPHADETLAERQVTSARPGGWSVVRGMARMLALLLGIAWAVVETLLGFRLAFLLGEANASNGFVEFIYDVTDPLVEPFQGIFANDTLSNGGVFEPATAIAMAVYFVAAALLIAAILVVTAGPSGGETVVTTRSRERAGHVEH